MTERLPTLEDNWNSEHCPICGKHKRRKEGFCRECYLPLSLYRQDLTVQLWRGLNAKGYTEAINWLRERFAAQQPNGLFECRPEQIEQGGK